jgi:hypothetical protein
MGKYIDSLDNKIRFIKDFNIYQIDFYYIFNKILFKFAYYLEVIYKNTGIFLWSYNIYIFDDNINYITKL